MAGCHVFPVVSLLSLIACSPQQKEDVSESEGPELTMSSPWQSLFPHGNDQRLDSTEAAEIPDDIFECPLNSSVSETLKTVGRKMQVKMRSNPEYAKTAGERAYSPYQFEFEKLGCHRIQANLAVVKVIDWAGAPYFIADRWIAFHANGKGDKVYLHYYGGTD